jgi:hypothetical protein
MNLFRLEDFFKGWVVGNFAPSLFGTTDFEVGVKKFNEGEVELAHKQLIATEITIVISGRVRIGDQILMEGDIAVIPPKEIADFESLSDSTLVCIKYPSIPNDKIII